MRLLNRYISKLVAAAIAVVLLVIVSLDFIAELLEQSASLSGEYNFLEVMIYCVLDLPSSLYDYLPLSSLIGCLVGLGLLASTSELTVIRAAGVSTANIIGVVMKPILGYILLALILGEWVTPLTSQYAESRKAMLLGHHTALQGRRGVWNREGNEFMHFSAVLPNGKLFGITRLKFDDNGHLVSSSYSESAIYQNKFWFLHNGKKTQLNDSKVSSQIIAAEDWHTELSPELLDVLVLSTDDLPIRRLLSYSKYLNKQGQSTQEYQLAFWKKALQPLAIASLVMIAISFIFGPLRQVTMGFRIFAGVMVGIIFRISQDMLGPSSLLFGFSPFIAVIIPIAFSAGIGFILLKKST